MFSPLFLVGGQVEEDVLELTLGAAHAGHGDAGVDEGAGDLRGVPDAHLHEQAAVLDAHLVDERQCPEGGDRSVRRGCHQLELGVPAQLFDGALPDDAAPVDHRHPLADLLHLAHQVARQDDGASLAAEVDDELAHVPHPLRVKTIRGLVEDDQLGVLEQRCGHAEALLHAQRVGPELVTCTVCETDGLESGADAGSRHPGIPGHGRRLVRPVR